MKTTFSIIIIASAVILTVCVLLQSSGSGLGTAFGGQANYYRSRRGAEKLIYNTTIVMAVVLVLSVVLSILSK